MPRPKHRPNRRVPLTDPRAQPFPYACPSLLTHPRVVCATLVSVTLLVLGVVLLLLMASFNGFKLPEGVTVEKARRIQKEAGMQLTNLERSKSLGLHQTVFASIMPLGKAYGYSYPNPDLDKEYERGTLRPPVPFHFNPKRFVSASVGEDESIEQAQERLVQMFSALDLKRESSPLVTGALEQLAVEKAGAWYAAEAVDALRTQLREQMVKDMDGPIFACTLVIPVDERSHISTNTLMPIVTSAMRHVYASLTSTISGPYVCEWTVNWKWDQMATLYLRFRTKSALDKASIYYAPVHPDNTMQHAEKFVEIAHKREAARSQMRRGGGSEDDDDD